MNSFDLGQFATELGWVDAGACAPDLSETHKTRFESWLEKSKGPQLDYLVRRKEERSSPTTYFSEAKSLLCFALYYFPGWSEGDVKVSNYAWAEDYHLVLKKK